MPAEPTSRRRAWAQAPAKSSGTKGIRLAGLFLLLLGCVAFFLWWVLFLPTPPRVFYAAIYVPDYDNRAQLLDPPFAESNAKQLQENVIQSGWAARGRNVLEPFAWKDALAYRGEVLPKIQAFLQERSQDSQDVVVVYVRSYGAVIDGVPFLLASNFLGNNGTGGAVPISDFLAEFAKIKARNVVLLLDSGELEFSLPLGILVNKFPEKLEAEVRKFSTGDNSKRIWVVNSNSTLQRSFVSSKAKSTLFAAAVVRASTLQADRNKDQQLSLDEFYGNLLHFASVASNQKQTPRLMLAGVGEVSPAVAQWKDSKGVVMALLASSDAESIPIPSTKKSADPKPENKTDDAKTASAWSVGLNRVSWSPQQQPPTAAEPPAVTPSTTVPPTTSVPATAASTTAAPASIPPPGAISEPPAESAPHLRAWQLMEQLSSRTAGSVWTPVDFAPHYWRELGERLAALDIKYRMLSDAEKSSATPTPLRLEIERLVSELIDLQKAIRSNSAASNTTSKLAVAWNDFSSSSLWSQRKRQWENLDNFPPRFKEQWIASQDVCRKFADLTCTLTECIRLQGALDSPSDEFDSMLRDLAKVSRVVRDLSREVVSVENSRIEEAKRLLVEGEKTVDQFIALYVAKAITPEKIGWEDDRTANTLLSSPLLTLAQRKQIEQWLNQAAAPVVDSDLTVSNEEQIDKLLQLSDSEPELNRKRLATMLERCLRLVTSSSDTPIFETDLDVDSLGSRLKLEWERGMKKGGDQTLVDTWFKAAMVWPSQVDDSGYVQPEAVAAIVISPTNKPELLVTLQEQLECTGTLEVATAKIVFSRSDGRALPNDIGIKVTATNYNDPAAVLDLKCNDRSVVWGEEQLFATINRELNLQVSAKKDQVEGKATAIALKIEAVAREQGLEPVSREINIVLPYPVHVDLFATWSDRKDTARRAMNRAGMSRNEALTGANSLFAPVQEKSAGNYQFSLVNRNKIPRKVRARLFAIPQGEYDSLRAGSTVTYGSDQPPSSLINFMDTAIRRGAVVPIAEGVVSLPAAPGGAVSEVSIDQAVPLLWQKAGASPPPATPAAAPAAPPALADPCDRGLLCLLEEIREDGTVTGRTWNKWIDVLPLNPVGVGKDPLEGEARTRPWELLERPVIRWESNQLMVINLQASQEAFGMFKLEELSVSAEVVSLRGKTAGSTIVRQGPLVLKFVKSSDQLKIQLPAEDLETANTEYLVHLDVGGYRRAATYSVRKNGTVEEYTGVWSELMTPRFFEQGANDSLDLNDPRFKLGDRILLPRQVLEKGVWRKLNYNRVEATGRFHAARNRFQRPNESSPDEIRIALSKIEPDQELESLPQRNSYRTLKQAVSILPDGSLQVTSQVSDPTFVYPLEGLLPTDGNSELNRTGIYKIAATLAIDGQPMLNDEVEFVIDRVAPSRDTVRTKQRGRDPLYLGESLTVELAQVDDLSGVEIVEFFLDVNGDGLISSGENGDIEKLGRKSTEGVWQGLFTAKEFEKLLPGEYQILARSYDRSGNMRDDHTAARVQWTGKSNPKTPKKPEPGAPAAAKLMTVELTVTREGVAIRDNSALALKGMPGTKQEIGDGKFRFTDVPEGAYTVSGTYKTKLGEQYTGEAPVEVKAGNAVVAATLNLEEAKK